MYRHSLQRRVSPDDDPPTQTQAGQAAAIIGLSCVGVAALGFVAVVCHYVGKGTGGSRPTSTVNPWLTPSTSRGWAWPKSLDRSDRSAMKRGLGFRPNNTNTAETGQELQTFPTGTSNANQQASGPPTRQDGQPSQPTSTVTTQTGVSGIRSYWPGLPKLPSIGKKLRFPPNRAKPAESTRERQFLPANATAPSQQTQDPSPLTSTTFSNTSRPDSINTINDAVAVEPHAFGL
jgi:hypothetical protein